MKPILLKIIRRALYGLAIPTGVAGLFIGGVPVVKYVVELMRDYENRYFYDTQYLNEPVIVFLLSLILLTGVRICFALDKGSQIADPPDSVPSGKKPAPPAPANEIAAPAIVGEKTTAPVETADEKLKRLLNQKKD